MSELWTKYHCETIWSECLTAFGAAEYSRKRVKDQYQAGRCD